MSHSIAVVQRSAPYNSQIAQESLDIALSFAIMDCNVSLFFIDDGVYQLIKQQAGHQGKSLAKNLAAMNLYGIDKLYCDIASLEKRDLTADLLIEGVTFITQQQFKQELSSQDRVFAL
jgi:tRNA 2-thiouridine synthesizing protein C